MARGGGKDRGVTFKAGRWWVRLYVQGRECWYCCDSKSQAKALYGRLKAEQREGKYFEKAKPVPFKSLAEEYVTQLAARRRRPGEDAARLAPWIAAFGEQDANSITPRQIERVLGELRIARRKANGTKREVEWVPPSPATLLRSLTVLKAVLNRGRRLGLLKQNPATLVQTPKPNNVLVRYLTNEQEQALHAQLPDRFRPIVMTAIHTGLRQGELLRLTWQDMDWTMGVLTIHQTKAGERRRVLMNSVVQALLAGVKAAQNPAPSDSGVPPRGTLSPARLHQGRH